MNRKIIIIEGYLASGKSTFALKLSQALRIPYLIKDTMKNTMCRNVTIENRAESSRYSVVTFDAMMYVVERLFECGLPVIIEGNFAPTGQKRVDEQGIINQLVEKYRYSSLNYKFKGDTRVLHQRFIEREKTEERGNANKLGFEVQFEDFNRWCHNLDAFVVAGTVVEVDTTDFSKVDFEYLVHMAKGFMNKQEEEMYVKDNIL